MIIPVWVGIVYFFVCIADWFRKDAKAARTERKPHQPAKPFDDAAWRKANGLPRGPEEVWARYERRFIYRRTKWMIIKPLTAKAV
jgi:hypothetical protein